MTLAIMRPSAWAKSVCAKRTAYLCGLILVLSGCATEPINPWAGLTVETQPAASPIDCGGFPLPTGQVGEVIQYDNEGVNDLEAFRVCSEANHDIVTEHAAQIGELKVVRKALVEAGQAQRNIATMREEMLEDERKHNFWMNIGQWFLIAVLGVAASD